VRYTIQIRFPQKPVVEIELDLPSVPAVGHVIEFFGQYELRLKIELVEHCFDFPSLNHIGTMLVCGLDSGSAYAIEDFMKAIK
jgi:hypothetical protein